MRDFVYISANLKKMGFKKVNNLIKMLIIWIMMFSSISFIDFYFPPRLFSFIEFNEIKIGFPFVYFHEYRVADREIANSWNYLNLFIDFILCIILIRIFDFIKFKKYKFFVNFLIIAVYSILLFSTISYFGLIKTAIFNDYRYEVGFPLIYYKQFWVSGNYFPNHGSNFKNFIFDVGISLLLVSFVFLLKRIYMKKFPK